MGTNMFKMQLMSVVFGEGLILCKGAKAWSKTSVATTSLTSFSEMKES